MSMPFAALGRAFDAEWFLLRDAERAPAEVAALDRRVLDAAPPGSLARRFEFWIEERRRLARAATPGLQLAQALGLLHVGLCLLSCALGVGAAAALLRPVAAPTPVNWLEFLAVTGALPALGLCLTVLSLLLARGRLRLGLRSELFQGLALRLSSFFASRVRSRAPQLSSVWGQVRATGGRYRQLEALSLAIASQDCALCFQLGAALSLVRLALLSDLYFAWATTFGALQPPQLSAFVDALQAPWVWAWPSLMVDLQTVRLTQYNRLSQQFVEAGGAALSGAWWPFLLGCLVTYGVLPRASLALGFRCWLALSARQMPGRIPQLRRRLAPGLAVAPPIESSEGAPPALDPMPQLAQAAESQAPAWFVAWRGAPLPGTLSESLCKDYRLRSVATHRAGGADYRHDSELLDSLVHEREAWVLLIVEGWESPDKSLRRFLANVRLGSPLSMRLVVVLREPGQPSRLSLWRDRLSLLADPHLSVEERSLPLAAGPSAFAGERS